MCRTRTGWRHAVQRAAAAFALLSLLLASPARAKDEQKLLEALRALAVESGEDAQRGIASLVELADPRAVPALDAFCDDRLKVAPDGAVYFQDAEKKALHDAITGAVVSPEPAGLKTVDMDNALRRTVLPLLARLKLNSPDPEVRLAAAEELDKRAADDALPLLRDALAKERTSKVHDALAIAIAKLDLRSPERERRLSAIAVLHTRGDGAVRGELERLIRRSDDGSYAEPDEAIRKEATTALSAIESRERMVSLFGDLIHGISLGSVLLFAALGLAVTFGLMGVINMAHGEMLMIGAYATYSIQALFEKYFPAWFELYVVVAIPVAFAVTTLVGVALERIVIRHLYGRQLETLLATWGISLGLIQTVRLIFGAQNVLVANPQWLAGGAEIAHGLVLPYNRIAIVAFVILVSLGVWLLLTRTRLGLQVRAVTQNRGMAASLGVPTARVDMWIFGLGCGIAGLGGVALSQLGNVGPELGQSYIIDSFMVVVLGGVGALLGTVGASLGLGIVNKILEPFAGAVLGKIIVLGFIILFIQRRPQGMFAPKGRVEA